LCATHYQRQRRHGNPQQVNPAGRPRTRDTPLDARIREEKLHHDIEALKKKNAELVKEVERLKAAKVEKAAAKTAEEVRALENELEAIRLSLPQKYQSQIAKAHAILQQAFQMGIEKLNATIDERLADRKAEMERKIAAAEGQELRYTKLVQDFSTFMTYEEFKMIRGCLHPDRTDIDKAKLGRAFGIFIKLESAVNKRQPIAELRKRGWAHVSPFYKR
jgi:NADH dehydrogenase/NADH:ubiquinone oxidoreductase subunit G